MTAVAGPPAVRLGSIIESVVYITRDSSREDLIELRHGHRQFTAWHHLLECHSSFGLGHPNHCLRLEVGWSRELQYALQQGVCEAAEQDKATYK